MRTASPNVGWGGNVCNRLPYRDIHTPSLAFLKLCQNWKGHSLLRKTTRKLRTSKLTQLKGRERVLKRKKVNGPKRKKLWQGRNSRQWAKHWSESTRMLWVFKGEDLNLCVRSTRPLDPKIVWWLLPKFSPEWRNRDQENNSLIYLQASLCKDGFTTLALLSLSIPSWYCSEVSGGFCLFVFKTG